MMQLKGQAYVKYGQERRGWLDATV